MDNKSFRILGTMPLPAAAIVAAGAEGVQVDAVPFITINFVADESMRAEVNMLCGENKTVVFTSAHAVRAVAAMGGTGMGWQLYCIGHATRNEVVKQLAEGGINGIANDAAALARIMIADGVEEVVFFCGDMRMDTLPMALKQAQITVRELVVYQTVATPHKVSGAYDGILFFSPSGVESFFSVNEVCAYTVLFAIGNTTAAAIRTKTNNKVVVATVPAKEGLLRQAIQYFHKQAMA